MLIHCLRQNPWIAASLIVKEPVYIIIRQPVDVWLTLLLQSFQHVVLPVAVHQSLPPIPHDHFPSIKQKQCQVSILAMVCSMILLVTMVILSRLHIHILSGA